MQSYFQLASYDVIDTCSELRPDSFDACFCDPPYGLKFMGKRWDHGVPGVEYWQSILRVLKPGAPILAFGGTRTYHRLACAIEDAGFEIFDSILASVWMYGQGFPKSLDIGKAIDKAAGVDRVVVGRYCPPDMKVWNLRRAKDGRSVETTHSNRNNLDITAPTTDEALRWNGYGTALKPAWEPIVSARKPLDGTYAANCIEHGCGGLNIDGSRIGTDPSGWGGKAAGGVTWNASNCGLAKDGVPTNSVGRYPANLILSHHPECEDGACHSDCPVRSLDEQTSGLKGGTAVVGLHRKGKRASCYGNYGEKETGEDHGYGDTGGASRFFYTAKVSARERNAGTAPGTNTHPTLKPLAFTTYLARLILPPGSSSRLLIPFCGTGSEIAGALIAGWSYVLGIDNDRESISIAHRRIPALLKHSRSKGL